MSGVEVMSSPTLYGLTHSDVGGITLCGRLTTTWVRFERVGGPPDCKVCCRVLEKDARDQAAFRAKNPNYRRDMIARSRDGA